MSEPSLPRLALVVFVDHAESPLLRGLRAGFRHCFVVLRDDIAWLACDPIKDRIEIHALPLPARFDLPGFYAARGHTVLLGPTRPDLRRQGFTLAPLTCVAIAKRLLGVRSPSVLTPWQLYRCLRGSGHHFLEIRRQSPPRHAPDGMPLDRCP